jgi:broad specificity phosphatase PhoE
MRMYFARHGESVANVLKVISNRPGVHGLTAKGREQAAGLAEALRGRVSTVYTSPLLRAVETAAVVCGALGLPLQVTDALREYDCGDLEGRSDAEAWAIHARWSGDWLEERDRDRGPEGGESFQQIQARFVPFVRDLMGAPAGAGEAPLLIGHGGIYRLMLPLVLENIDHAFVREHRFPNCSSVVADGGRGRLRCLEWCGAAL